MLELTQYMKTRRSSLSLTLDAPGPDEVQLRSILEIASRVPDHGKLAPWRFELWPMAVREKVHNDLQHLLTSLAVLPVLFDWFLDVILGIAGSEFTPLGDHLATSWSGGQ